MTNEFSRLHRVTDGATFDAFARDTAASSAFLQQVRSRLGMHGAWTRPTRGSALLAISAGEVLKLMPPHDAAMSAVERACLQRLDRALPVPTPRLLDAGTVDGWPYLRMTRLRGHELADAWPILDHATQLTLATELGEALRALHAIDAPPEIPRLDWPAWIATRSKDVVATQRAKGCPQALLNALPTFIAHAPLDAQRVGWLHTEIMREHLLCENRDGRWHLSGLFDFEPSWVAPVDYEFASLGLFFSAGNPSLLAAVMDAAGVTASPQRLFAMTLFHRYANLAWYHSRLGGPLDLDDLATRWFGTS